MSWDWENSNVDDYGGFPIKFDHDRESRAPHAYGLYRLIQGALGSLYSKEKSGLLHAENLADARAFTAALRTAEKLEHNSFPSRSDDALSYWVNILGVNPGPLDSDDDIRRKCQAKYQSFNGNDAVNVQTAVATMLGDAFVAVHRNGQTPLDEPSVHTYWPGVNPGPVIYDLDGTGAWLSDNAHLLVEYDVTTAIDKQQLARTVRTDLPELLDDMLPAWSTFEAAENQCFTIGDTGLEQAGMCD